MPWADLSEVTVALRHLLELNINLVLSPGLNPTVVGTPPDQLGNNVINTISVYLHHVKETACTQNLSGPGSDRPNIATAPLGLDLFYVVTAHQRAAAGFDAVIEQRLMGYTLKTFHDYPVLTDATVIVDPATNLPSNVFVGGQRGRDNRLNIELRKLEPDQALAIWTTGERQFARLAAYYQIGLVQLEPERARRFPGLVLSVGAFATPLGGVTLTGSRNQVTFDLPAIAGGGVQSIRVEPARPALTAPPGPNSTFTLIGENLAGGLRRRVVLRNARWARLPTPAERVPVDPPLNAAHGWTFDFRADRIDVRAGNQVTYQPADGGPLVTIDVFPGTYMAYVETITHERVVAGQPRVISTNSNETPIALAARILNHVITAASNTIRLNFSPAFAMNISPPAGERLDIQVTVDGQAYRRRLAAGALQPGEFRPLAGAIRLHALFPVVNPGLHTVRVMVEGVDAQPYWIPTP